MKMKALTERTFVFSYRSVRSYPGAFKENEFYIILTKKDQITGTESEKRK
jgi:hypothetical protein